MAEQLAEIDRIAADARSATFENTIAALEKLMQFGALGVADGQALISAAWLEHGLTADGVSPPNRPHRPLRV